jgi:hypothetical protein
MICSSARIRRTLPSEVRLQRQALAREYIDDAQDPQMTMVRLRVS